MPNLDVPTRFQNPDKAECVPHCLNLCLEYLKEEYDYEIPEKTKDDLKNILETDEESGTEFGKIDNLREKLKQERSEILVKKATKADDITFKHIIKKIDDGFPVIIFANLGILYEEETTKSFHALIIKGYQEEKGRDIIYFDSLKGEQKENQFKINRAWSKNLDKLTIFFEEKEAQTKLGEYQNEGEKRKN